VYLIYNMILEQNIKQSLFLGIKIAIVLVTFLYIYQKLIHENTFSNVHTHITFLVKNAQLRLEYIIFIPILSLSNWFFEVLKWQSLVSEIKKITLLESLEQSLGPLAASLFTPNRIGEYAAKPLYYHCENRLKAIFITVINNALQMFITVVLGCIGLFYFIKTYHIYFNYKKGSLYVMSVTVVLIISWFVFQKIKPEMARFITSYPKYKLYIGLQYALWRYTSFTLQFYLLLLLSDIDMTYHHAMMIITSYYLVSSIIPTIAIFDIFIKGGVALYLFSFANIDSTIISSIIVIMWILNFAIPSILGSYYVFSFKLNSINIENQDVCQIK